MVGEQVGRFKVLEELGPGGRRFLADDSETGRRVVLSLLPADSRESLQALRHRLREAASLRHPSLTRPYSAEDIDGHRFVVSSPVDGDPLPAMVPEGGLPTEELLRRFLPLAEAMALLHERHQVHGNISADNIFFSKEGGVELSGFGVARDPIDVTTQTALACWSPEEIEGEAPSLRSDVFSLGVVLYYLTAGRPPFTAESREDMTRAILEAEPTPVEVLHLGLPKHISSVVRRCLSKKPKKRYKSATLVHQALSGSWELKAAEAAARQSAALSTRLGTPVDPIGRRGAFVGREAELGTLLQRLDALQKGQGCLMLLTGEPGLGKTRLAEQVLSQARRREFLTLAGHCEERLVPTPFEPWATTVAQTARLVPEDNLRTALGSAAPQVAKMMPLLRRYLSDIDTPVELPPQREQAFLFDAFTAFLARGGSTTPIVILLDEIDRASPSSLSLLAHVASRVHELPLLVMATYDDPLRGEASPFGQRADELLRNRAVERIVVEPFSESEVADLLEVLSDRTPPDEFTGVLCRVSGGNPLFVEQVFALLCEDNKVFDRDGNWRTGLGELERQIPRGIGATIYGRLLHLNDATLQLLTAASIIDEDFSLSILEELSGRPPAAFLDSLVEAERALLINPASRREARYAFRHSMLRRALLAQLSPAKRRTLHLKLTRAIENAHPGQLSATSWEMAHHQLQAGSEADPARTVYLLSRAGEQAHIAGAYRDAEISLTRALTIKGVDDPAQRGDILMQRALARWALGEDSATIEDADAALPLYDSVGDGIGLARACLRLSAWRRRQGHPHEAVETARRGLAAIGTDPSEERCRLLAETGLGDSAAGDTTSGAAVLNRAAAMAEKLGSDELKSEIRREATVHYASYMRASDAADNGKLAVQLLRQQRAGWSLSKVLGSLVLAHDLLARFEEAEAYRLELRPLAARLGDHESLALALTAKLSRFHATGDFAAYREHAAGGAETFTAADRMADGHALLGFGHFWSGDWLAARDAFDEAAVHAPRHPWNGAAAGQIALGLAYLDPECAPAWIDRHAEALPPAAGFSPIGAWGLLAGVTEALSVLGKRERCAELFPLTIKAMATGTVYLVPFGLLEKAAGISAACSEDWERADRHFKIAVRQVDDLSLEVEYAEVRRWYAEMLLSRAAPGDQQKARRMLGEAIEKYRTLGMTRHVALAVELMTRF